MAHIAGLATARNDEARLAAKVELTLGLLDAGYGEADAQRLCQFFDWLLRLPEPLTERFIETIQDQEGARPMKIVTSVERIGHRIGLEQGLEQGVARGLAPARREDIARIRRRRFANDAELLVQSLDQVTSLQALVQLFDVALDGPNRTAVRQAIPAAQSSGPPANSVAR